MRGAETAAAAPCLVRWLAVAACVVLPVLSSLCEEVAAAAAVHAPYLCVLPLGDSLTQGLWQLGSYRSYLHDLLLAETGKANALIAGHGFFGSEDEHCYVMDRTVRNGVAAHLRREGDPTASGRPSTFTMPHQGHCGWSARHVAAGLASIFNSTGKGSSHGTKQERYRASFRSCLEKAAARGKSREAAPPVLVVVTLLVGHNDAFHSAGRCALLRHKPTVHQEKQKCVEAQMEVYRRNIDDILQLLEDEYVVRQKLPLLVLFGLNPPTYFGLSDKLLHQHIRAEAQEWERRKKKAVVRLVEFEGFHVGLTVDSTHPDRHGSELLARCWMKSLRACLRSEGCDAGGGGNDDDDGDGAVRFLESAFNAWALLGLLVAALCGMMVSYVVRWRRRPHPRDRWSERN
ncbi:hypothetical protein DQ04_10991010 [Trypanosoma grayi]|uniref:hypothetical protein n=1 Tax=Trypanosoma grayi TaxID=71804 RepID=UPI0004F427F7|nr:hypothetical protein DQ04_10991010 [Trypanosoma grayi]KEG07079.1 hypothetical protein DQ04_10991010 [Trypanosoma grayi]